MPLVLDSPQRVAQWVGQQVGQEPPDVEAAIGYESDGKLVAGVYFDSMLPNTVFAHIANTSPTMPRSLLAATCWYAFRVLRVERLTFMVDEANDKVVRLAIRLGSSAEARLHRAFGRSDALIFTFWRDCHWSRKLIGPVPVGAGG